MKYTITKFLFLLMGIAVFISCKKIENKVVFEGGQAPTLSASVPTNSLIPMSMASKEKTAIEFNWTNPDYKFNTGVSSQDVNYTLQIDKVGANFSSPDRQEISLSKDLDYKLTVGKLNEMFANLGLPENVEASFEVRLKSYLGDGSVPLYSNVLTFRAVPYLDVAVKLPERLFLIGSATPGDWNQPVPEPSQEFTKTSSTTFEITISLKGGMEYLAIPVNGSWDHKYAVKNPDHDSELWKGGNFGYDYPDNFPGPPTDGVYKIVFEFKTGKFTVTKQ